MQISYKILPKRAAKKTGLQRSQPKMSFYTNYYDIDIQVQNTNIYQYCFTLSSQIPQDSEVYDKAIASSKKILHQKIDYIAHSGQMLWGKKQLKTHSTIQCCFKVNQDEYKIQSTIKLVKQLNFRDLNDKNLRQNYFQILNTSIKNTLKILKLNQLGKSGLYFQRDSVKSIELQQKKLDVIQGFRFTLTALNSGNFLQIDTCSRVLQSGSLYDKFLGKQQKQIKQIYTGQTIISKYGAFKTYTIQEIDFSKNPMSTFFNQKKGETMTYKDYFKISYGANVHHLNQPLLRVLSHAEKIINKDKTIKEVKHYVYIIPQLASITGLTDQQTTDFRTMKALQPFTKLSPIERVKRCADIIQKFNKSNKQIKIKSIKKLDGYLLEKPKLHYANKSIYPQMSGIIKHRGFFKQTHHFKQWLFVYSQNNKRDHNEANNAIDNLKKAAQVYGIKIEQPVYIFSDVSEWKKQISIEIKQYGKVPMIVFFVKPHEEKYYGQLKKFVTNQLNCSCQFIKKSTLSNPRSSLSAASKILIQMNVKVGCSPWEVQKRHPAFKDKKLIYGSLSISRGQKGSTLAFVGTSNKQCTKVFSSCKYGIKSKESISVNDFEDILLNWVTRYYDVNKQAPNLIILYRQGLSLPQTACQLSKVQIPAFQNMFSRFGQVNKIQNYKPEIIIVTVNKSINSRIYRLDKDNKESPFTPSVRNVDSGSIISQPLSSDDGYDFHLASQYVSQGTCTPTLFRVAYDTSNLPQTALQDFTFEQCFNYYNWEGAVKVPATLQCADKLSKLVSMSMKCNIKQSQVTNQHFFL